MYSKDIKGELKITVVGNCGTGKTSFCSRWAKNSFAETYKATIMTEFIYKIYEYKGYKYKVQFWDLGGQDKNIYVSKCLTKDSNACIILCDVENEKSLQDTLKWKESLSENTEKKIPIFLIQNKIDLLDEEEQKNNQRLKKFSEEQNFITYFRVSAKMDIGVKEAMDSILKYTIEKIEEGKKNEFTPVLEEKKSIKLKDIRENKEEKKESQCC